MYRMILVPLDGSPQGELALSAAIGLAERSKAELRLLHALDVVSLPAPDKIDHYWRLSTGRQDVEAYLNGLAKDIATRTNLAVSREVVDGRPAPTIMDVAKRCGADLIVMCTHGYGTIERAWLGSVADAVVRQSQIPVLLIRSAKEKAWGGTEFGFRHVLLTLDGYSLAEQMLEPAADFARLNDARLTLLRIVHPWVAAVPAPVPAHHVLEVSESDVAGCVAEAEQYLGGIALEVVSSLTKVDTATVVAEQPDAQEILGYARRHDVDVIALATHGRGGVKRLLLGSVADKVIRGANVPVLVLRPAD